MTRDLKKIISQENIGKIVNHSEQSEHFLFFEVIYTTFLRDMTSSLFMPVVNLQNSKSVDCFFFFCKNLEICSELISEIREK